MEKYIYNEKNGLHYELVGDYYLPCLTIDEPEQPIGIWGQRRSHFLKEHKKIEYMNLLTAGKLNAHLVEVDQQAQDMYDQLMHQIAVCAGITEQLKATDQIAWVGAMNNIRNTAEEIVVQELVFV